MQTYFHFEYHQFLGLRRLVLGADPCVSKVICIQPLLLGNHQSTDISEIIVHTSTKEKLGRGDQKAFWNEL